MHIAQQHILRANFTYLKDISKNTIEFDTNFSDILTKSHANFPSYPAWLNYQMYEARFDAINSANYKN